MVFENGFFHADLHPGNLFIQDDGTIVILDFGIMGRIDAHTRKYLAEMLLGFITRDFLRVSEVHKEAGYIPQDTDINTFAQACRAITEPILNKPLGEISVARLLGQLFKVTEEFDMQTQPQLLMLQKSMLLAEGTSRLIAPNLNMWQLTKPLVEKWVQRELGIHGKLRDTILEASNALKRLPSLIDNIDKTVKQIEETNLIISNHTKTSNQYSFYWRLLALSAIICSFFWFY
jgi:ubiquinone biosynthesis protein